VTDPTTLPSINIHTVAQPPTGHLAVFSQPGGNSGLQQRQTLEIGVTNQQIALIATTQIETKIRERIGDFRKSLEDLRKQEVALVNSQNAILESWCRDRVAEDATNVTSLAAALKPFTGRDLTTSYGVAAYNARTRRLSATASFNSGEVSVPYTYTAEAPATFIADVDRLTELSRSIKDAEERIRQAKLTLSNMDAVARQAEASIAQSTLNQTEEGRKMADAIREAAADGNVDDLIRRLQV